MRNNKNHIDKKANPKIAIVTLNFNGKKYLEKHYLSLLRQSYTNYQLIMVDNGSFDGSEDFIGSNFPNVRIIKLKKNIGPAGGYNKGGFAVKDDCKYIVFIGNDTWCDDDWLKELITKAESDNTIAICGSRQMNYDGSVEKHLGGMGLDIFGYPTVPIDKSKDCFYADGVSLLIKNSIFKKIDGFDKRYFVYVEEVDLAWKARLLGYKIATAPKSVFYHALGGTLDSTIKSQSYTARHKTSLLKRFLSEKNSLCTIIKNYSALSLFIILPLTLFFNTIEASFFLFIGKPQMSLIYIRSWLWNLENLKETIIRRNKIQHLRVVSDIEILKRMYFGLGKIRTFRKIGIPQIV